MALVQENEATLCICSEEDLQRAIELGKWYDSEEESCSSDADPEDTDSGSRLNSFSQIEVKTIWAACLTRRKCCETVPSDWSLVRYDYACGSEDLRMSQVTSLSSQFLFRLNGVCCGRWTKTRMILHF